MRLAAATVGGAVLAVGMTLLSITPVAPSAHTQAAQLPVSLTVDTTFPLAASDWRSHLVRAAADEPGERAAAASLAFQTERALALALEAHDPAERELAALWLNTVSGRVACDHGARLARLDELDRLVAMVRRGEPVAALRLAEATEAAERLNHGDCL